MILFEERDMLSFSFDYSTHCQIGIRNMDYPIRNTGINALRSIVIIMVLSQGLASALAQTEPDLNFKSIDTRLDSLLSQVAISEDTVTTQKLLLEVLDSIENQLRMELFGYHDGEIRFPTNPITPNEISGNTAIIYSVALEERLLHLVLHNSLVQTYEVNVEKNKLARAIRYFNEELQISTSFGGLERASIELYNWLVAPYAEELRENAIEKIVFVSSETLRPFPMAALFDGQRNIVDEFALATSLGLLQTSSDTFRTAVSGAISNAIEAFNHKDGQDLLLSLLPESSDEDILLSASQVSSRDTRAILERDSAYLAVGAATGIVSLWPIDEGASASLLVAFNSGLNNGLSKIESLRNAQLELKSVPRFSHPYYWSSFRLVGNWD